MSSETPPVETDCPRCGARADLELRVTDDIAIYRCRACTVGIYKNLVSGKIERILPGPKTGKP